MLRGRIDHPLSELGWQQMTNAAGLAGPFTDQIKPSLPWTTVVSSPLQRCRSFGEHLAHQHDLPLTVESDWQEIDYGDWDGMLLTEWRETAAYQFREFRKDMSALHPPNGESFVDFRDRILGAWEKLLTLPDGSHVLLLTHGGVMRVILPTILGIPLNRNGVLEIPFACLSRVEVNDGRAVLTGHNVLK